MNLYHGTNTLNKLHQRMASIEEKKENFTNFRLQKQISKLNFLTRCT